MAEPIRWGILGASNFARGVTAPAINAATNARLAALGTPHPDKAAPFAAIAPGLEVFDSYEALLASDRIDAVYVPLPNHLHVEWALKALDAGKPVLVEKPLALQAGDFDALIARRDATGLMAAEAFMITHHPQWAKVRSLLAEGAIGSLRHVHATFTFRQPDTANIRNRPEAGGGAMRDVGVYILGSVRFATGEDLARVTYADLQMENGVDVLDRVEAAFPSFTYTGLVSLRLAMRQEVVFYGEEGAIRLPAAFTASLAGEARVELERGGESTVWRWPSVNQYVLQFEAFGRSVREGAAFACPLEFSRGTQAAMDAVFAAASGRAS